YFYLLNLLFVNRVYQKYWAKKRGGDESPNLIIKDIIWTSCAPSRQDFCLSHPKVGLILSPGDKGLFLCTRRSRKTLLLH
ncbi:hypothetical protein KKA57_02085, partial [Patescibacteria group bacterium]|nr:hypothetical protein [Patescibacteria group bacterium]